MSRPAADLISDALESSGLSLRGLAQAVDVSPSHLSRALNGEKTFSVPLVVRCAEILGFDALDCIEVRVSILSLGWEIDEKELDRAFERLRKRHPEVFGIAIETTGYKRGQKG